MTIYKLGLMLALTAVAGLANAAELVQNGSFEAGQFTNPDGYDNVSLATGATNLTGWTISGPEIGWLQYNGGVADWGIRAADGVRSLDFTGYHNDLSFGTISQTLATQIGQRYVLSFSVGAGGFTPGAPGVPGVNYGGPDTIIGEIGGVAFSGTNPNGRSADTTWVEHQLSFVATGTSTVLTFSANAKGDCCFVGLDKVSVQAVPEPDAMAMMSAGLFVAGLVLSRQRRV